MSFNSKYQVEFGLNLELLNRVRMATLVDQGVAWSYFCFCGVHKTAHTLKCLLIRNKFHYVSKFWKLYSFKSASIFGVCCFLILVHVNWQLTRRFRIFSFDAKPDMNLCIFPTFFPLYKIVIQFHPLAFWLTQCSWLIKA